MKTINEKTLLEVVETLEASAKNEAYNYGEEISDDYQKRINELKQVLTVSKEVVTAIDELHAFACQSPDTTPDVILKITKVIENHLGIRMEVK